jgi:hypothetical protein
MRMGAASLSRFRGAKKRGRHYPGTALLSARPAREL